MNDEIVNEVRRTREQILQRFGSMERYNEHLMVKQLEYGSRLISRCPKRVFPALEPGKKATKPGS